jgi:predicted  nucleic acid-binding Zn-ribbon protein
MRPHDEFLELCAISTSGDLTEKESKRLEAHLAVCPECRQALQEFEAAVDVGMPLLSSKLAAGSSEESVFPNRELIGSLSSHRASSGTVQEESIDSAGESKRGFAFSQGNGHGQTKLNWNYVWIPFAACILLTAALAIYSYRIGRSGSAEVNLTTAHSSDAQIETLEQQMADAGHEREILRAQVTQRESTIAELRRRIEVQSAQLEGMKATQANLEQAGEAEKGRIAEERAKLAQKLDAAEASIQKTEAELDSMRQQRSQEQLRAMGLEAQVSDLSSQLRNREAAIGKQEELLAHDRDIRELMGARDLYIAEVYDVARDAATQKTYGRVFYTKGKSLIFYAYDLNEEAGPKKVSTFQAWGRRGPDWSQALSLGIFYEDNAAKKRWVLKLDDAKRLAQIDAVFVTVEPNGGSPKPSGKPFLFAYLKIDPNHP